NSPFVTSSKMAVVAGTDVFRFAPCDGPCCGDPCPGASNLCNDTFSKEMSVAITGIADDVCAECNETFNNTFILTNDCLSPGNTWYYELPSTVCGVNYILLGIVLLGGTLRWGLVGHEFLTAISIAVGRKWRFQEVPGHASVDCTALSNYEVESDVSLGPECDASGAQAVLNSL
ncbi:unnamed protein product, partial [marine sediment metagenome]